MVTRKLKRLGRVAAHYTREEFGKREGKFLDRALGEVERSIILAAYEASGRNKVACAKYLGISRATLYKRLYQYGER